MRTLCFTIPGEPQPWRRARLFKGRHFKDARTEANQASWAWAAHQALDGAAPLEGPLSVAIVCRFIAPPSAPKKTRAAMLAGVKRPTKRPDLDNLIKNLDGLNGVAFADDAQVVQIAASKVYAETAGVDITIIPLGAA